MAAIYQAKGFGEAKAFIAAASHGELIHDIDPAAKDLEGYLFPETYPLPRRTGAVKLVQMMAARFEKVFTAELRQAAAARGLTVRQAVTRARRAGLTVRIRRHRDLSPDEMALAIKRADDWRDTETERGFSMALGRLGDPADGDCMLVEASSEAPATALIDRSRTVLTYG